MGKKPQKRQVVRPVMKQKAKAVSKQEVKLVVKQPKPQVSQVKHPNPYMAFVNEHKNATVDDLTTYFEFRNTRVSARSPLALSAVLSALAMLLVIYYPVIEFAEILDILPLGNFVALLFVGGTIATVAFMAKQAKVLSPKETERHMKMYLYAKRQLQARSQVHEQPQVISEEAAVPEPQAAEINELAEELEASEVEEEA